MQQARGGSLFARREAALIAKALLRPGGLDRLLSDSRRRVVMGLVDDVAVGFGLGRVEDVGDTTIGVIDGIYVEPDARGVGIGTSVLEDLAAWFGRSGCRGVDGTALPGDRAAKSFFEAAGFRARLITMHRDLT